jgi:uncharacterized protein (DUF433 family)
MTFQRITTDPEVLGGVPCIRGLRVPVATVAGMLAEAMTVEESSPTSPTWNLTTSPRPALRRRGGPGA